MSTKQVVTHPYIYVGVSVYWPLSGLTLESKGMRAIFQKKGKKKGQQRAKYSKISAKTYKIWKYFEKGKPHACDYCTHEAARICPACVWSVSLYLSLMSNQSISKKPPVLDC